MTTTTLYIAMSKRRAEDEYQPVTDPVEKGAAVRAIKQQWALGKMARLVPVHQELPREA